MLIAQADITSRINDLQMPSQTAYVDSLADVNLFVAMFIFACGLVYLLQGWKVFKILVIVNAAVLGGFLGVKVGSFLEGSNMPIFVGIAGGALLAVLSWPLMKFAVSLMGGLAGSFLGYGLWNYVAEVAGKQQLADYGWVGALLGLITLGLLALVIFKAVIIIFTSLQGSLMTVSGIVAILMKFDPLKVQLETGLKNIHVLPLLIGLPAIIGVAFQHSAFYKKSAKKPSGDPS